MITRLRRILVDERGSSTIWFAVVVGALFMIAGLVADGSSKIRAARMAQLAANEAARAAGQHLTPAAIEGKLADVDPVEGASAAQDYLAQTGVSGNVSVQGRDVVITTSVPWSPRFLPIGGKAMQGTATTETIRT